MDVIKSKAEMNRDEIIRYRLKKMLKMAEEISTDLIDDLARKEQYIRICGEKFMPVSVAENSPLSGYGKGQCGKLSTALQRFATPVEPICEGVLKKKGERRLQAWMIREALQNNRSLKGAFRNPLQVFENIWFALDEVSLGDKNHHNENGFGANRCDLLCVCQKGNQFLPLVIELKYERQGSRLIEQVVTYAEELEGYRSELDLLLKTVTGKPISIEPIQKMVIMPRAKKGQENSPRVQNTCLEYCEAGIHLVEYSTDKGFGLYSVEPVMTKSKRPL